VRELIRPEGVLSSAVTESDENAEGGTENGEREGD